LARFSASGIIFVVPAILLWLWFSGGRQGHRQALFCTLSILIALGLGSICGMLLFHPRPFMIPLGHTWINHPADNSFPSDHGTVMFSAAFALLSLRHAPRGSFCCWRRCPWPGRGSFLGFTFRWTWWGRRWFQPAASASRSLSGQALGTA
jgi:undecaprenyl-diphosphatase